MSRRSRSHKLSSLTMIPASFRKRRDSIEGCSNHVSNFGLEVKEPRIHLPYKVVKSVSSKLRSKNKFRYSKRLRVMIQDGDI